jgi:hypothetical protein
MKWRGPIGGGAASGAVGSIVASHAKGTQYLRARTVPVNRNSAFQQAVRSAMKTLSSLWSTLTGSQRESWATYADNVLVVNALGDAGKISGFNWFVGNNSIRGQAGFDFIETGSPILNRGNPDWNAAAPVLSFANGGSIGTLTFAGPLLADNGTNGFLAIFASRPFSAGRSSAPGSSRLAATVAGGVTGGTAIFTLPFPTGGTLTKLETTLRLDQGDGRLSSTFQVQGGG